MSEVKNVKISEEDKMKSRLHDFIVKQDHPCMMAQSVFSQNQADIHIYGEFGTIATAKKILHDLEEYLARYDFESNDFFSFIAVFKGQKDLNEDEFEEKLWKQLQ